MCRYGYLFLFFTGLTQKRRRFETRTRRLKIAVYLKTRGRGAVDEVRRFMI